MKSVSALTEGSGPSGVHGQNLPSAVIWSMIEPMANLKWEDLTSEMSNGKQLPNFLASRAPVPGGWLVIARQNNDHASGLTFVPDVNHTWAP